MANHVIKRGLDIPIKGKASGSPLNLPTPKTVSFAPTEIRGLVPRLAIKQGQPVKKGQILFYHKPNPALVFRSPASGTLKEIKRGARRVITDIVVEVGEGETESFGALSAAELEGMSRVDAKEAVLRTGLWAILQTRPLDNMPNPESAPQAIVVSAMETGPLCPDADVLFDDLTTEDLQMGLDALAKLSDGAVHLTMRPGTSHPVLTGIKGVAVSTFSGPHPAGDPGLQANFLCPPTGHREIWTARAWDVALLGKALRTGEFPCERVYAAVGAGCAPRFVKTLLGAPIAQIVDGMKDNVRVIRGSVLTGETVEADRWASYRTRTIHILPAEIPRAVLGWATPRFGAWSFHKTFLSGLLGSRPADGVDMRPGLGGGVRAIVPFGVYRKVVATPDLMPEFLFKSIIANDLEESISLGLLDLTMEEAALCTYICPSKIDCDVVLRNGLDMYEREA